MKNLDEHIAAFSALLKSLKSKSGNSDDFVLLEEKFDELKKNIDDFYTHETKVLDHFENLVNLLPEIIFEIDDEGTLLFLNNFGIQKLGLGEAEVSNRLVSIDKLIHPEDLGQVKSDINRVLHGEKISGPEYRLLTTAGEEINAQVFNSPVVHNGKIQGLRGIVIDITERKKIENDFRVSAEKYKSIFDNSPLAIGYYTKDGFLTDCNQTFATMLGNTIDGLRGFNIFRDLQNQGMLDALKESLVSGSSHYEGAYQSVLTDRQGHTRVLFQGIRNGNNEITGGVALAEDITERINAENALKASEEQFRNLVENIGEGAGITDADNVFQFANPSAHKIFGVDYPGLINRPLQDFLSDEELARITHETEKRKEGLVSTYELQIIRQDGELRDLLVTVTPNNNENGEFLSSLGIFRDITERKKIEIELQRAHKTLLKKNEELQVAKLKAEESEKLKSAFLGTMTHELRTPLNGIIGLANLFEEDMTGSEVMDFAEEINKSGYKLLDMIDDIFRIIELEAGSVKPDLQPQNVGDLLKAVMEEADKHRKIIGKNYLQLRVEISPEAKNMNIMTDADILKKIYQNLVHNALKFTNDGEVVIGAEVLHNNQLQFYITDTGIGIPFDQQHNLFKRFRQLDQGHNREHGGTGLGLYYSKMLIQLLDGKIEIESTEGQGTTFFFTLSQE